MDKKRIGVLFGGKSSEHEVSRVSAKSIIDNIPRDKYDVVMVGITKKGEWRYYDGSTEKLPTGEWETDPSVCTAIISPDPTQRGLIVFRDGRVETVTLDAVFPALHGRNGEDGSVQGLLQLAGLPCVGCDIASSAICMDKALTNTICEQYGIRQAKWMQINNYEYSVNGDELCEKAVQKLGFPIFVKPANAGSSVGISKAADLDGLKNAIDLAFKYDSKLVLEEGIDAREIECAVLGNEEPIASALGEIIPANDFYDYDAKYVSDSGLIIPAELPENIQTEIRETAIRAYRAWGCSGLARVDFFVRKSDGCVLLNEPNTIPGFTSISMYPKLFEASGIPYSELLDRLITLAMERTGA